MNIWSTCRVDRVVTDLVAVLTRLLLLRVLRCGGTWWKGTLWGSLCHWHLDCYSQILGSCRFLHVQTVDRSYIWNCRHRSLVCRRDFLDNHLILNRSQELLCLRSLDFIDVILLLVLRKPRDLIELLNWGYQIQVSICWKTKRLQLLGSLQCLDCHLVVIIVDDRYEKLLVRTWYSIWDWDDPYLIKTRCCLLK